MKTNNYAEQVKVASGINALLGLWLLISPWAQGYAAIDRPSAWNNAIVGLLIAFFAEVCFFKPHRATVLSWANLLLGAWTAISPWVYGYAADDLRLASSLIVGIAVCVLSLWSGRATTMARQQREIGGIERSRG